MVTKIRFAICTLVAALALSPSISLAAETAPPPSITAQGTASTTAQPDEGYVTFGIETTNKLIATAMRDNSRAMTALRKVIADHGVTDANVGTIGFNVFDAYDDTKVGSHTKIGFTVSNVIRVKICELDKFGALLDSATSLYFSFSGAHDIGHVSVGQISFGYSKAAEKYDEARTLACAAATARANLLAKGLSLKLGGITDVRETPQYGAHPSAYAGPGGRADMVESPTPISGGSLTFTAGVTVTWQVK